jgi:hypothetical protein
MAVQNNSQIVDMTTAIERVPFKPGLITSLGLYRGASVATDAVTFDVRDNSLAILDDHLRNVAQKNGMSDRQYDIHTLAIPSYPIVNTLGREKLAGIRGFGKESEQMVAAAVAEELERQSERHDVHYEYLTALMTMTGKIDTNHYGTIDAAVEFGVSRPTQLLTAGSIAANIREAQSKAKAGLKNGGRTNGYVIFAGASMFEAIVSSEDVAQAWQFAQGAAMNPLRNELGTIANGYTMFRFGNTDIVLYEDSFQDKEGNTIEPLGTNEGVMVPRTELGRAFFGPASTLSALGSIGSRRFAATYRDPKDRYIEVESEQNVLVLAEQFAATVTLTK